MATKSKPASKYLEEINNISEDFSGTDEDELSEKEEILMANDTILWDCESELIDSEDEEVNSMNKLEGQKRMRMSSKSEVEKDTNNQHSPIDGCILEEVQISAIPGRLKLDTIFKEVTGPTKYARRNIMNGKMKTAFSLIITDQIMQHIRLCTIEEANRVLETEWNLSQEKLDAFLGILYARGAYEAKNLKVSFLWNGTWGPKFFSETMSRNCFTEILRFLRFDKKRDRSQRLKSDKFALMSWVWNKFIENSQKCYKPGTKLSVDEQLFATKARCRFTHYMPNKPDRYGIKFWLVLDVDNKYIVNALPHLGPDEDKPSSVPLNEHVVLKLVEPFMDCGRTVITDSKFISLSLATKLLAKKTALVGIIRGNKRDLPKVAKKQDNVKNEKPDKSLPESILFYTQSKVSGDMIDQMAKKFSTKSKSHRWPLQVFFNILDLAAINAWILYKETTGEKISRQDFLLKLAVELAADYREAREKQITNMEIASINFNPDPTKRRPCQIKYCKDNKTTKICSKCKKYVCGKCAFEPPCICKKCAAQRISY